MKQLIITLNGQTYEVTVREKHPGGPPAKTPAVKTQPDPATMVNIPPSPTTAQPQPKVSPAAPGTDQNINAPMPGTILSVNVKAGDQVKKGDLLLILEAMKMANEVISPVDGTVGKILVTPNQTVNTGDLMITLQT